jgi:DNA-binding transcriptional LysR family regulator
VVDGGSFVQAADAVDMSNTSVSHHDAEKEQRLGVRLLHHTTRKLSLTEEGDSSMEDARPRFPMSMPQKKKSPPIPMP